MLYNPLKRKKYKEREKFPCVTIMKRKRDSELCHDNTTSVTLFSVPIGISGKDFLEKFNN